MARRGSGIELGIAEAEDPAPESFDLDAEALGLRTVHRHSWTVQPRRLRAGEAAAVGSESSLPPPRLR
ncbi:hypothetical protein GCM10027079_11230 [Sediminivirga luteola]|uniref:Uncharacterized protein n=1 Tax=Sediminivirga luteola TaxID=1774748 RepID=A0A8J2XL07_9MICO|nr:hypothetical protein GCM10011333_22330 [Sediminivirga luteola]